jgi:hypothetical protein
MARIKQPGRGWAYTGAIIAVEILARTAWPRGISWHLLRWAGLLPVAGVAAFVSYRHLSGLLQHYGEEPTVYYIGPLAVDGLMIMATGALLAGGRAARRPAHGPTESTAATAKTVQPPTGVPADPAAPAPPLTPARVAGTPPVKTPAAAPTPVQVKARIDARQPTVAASTRPARSSTDTPVTASDPAPPKPMVAPGQLARARHVAEAHHKTNGAAITPGELAVRMRISTERANQLLAALNHGEPSTATRAASNGTPVTSSTR